MPERFKFDRMELAGSLGDLGTLLPIAIAMVLVNGLNPHPADVHPEHPLNFCWIPTNADDYGFRKSQRMIPLSLRWMKFCESRSQN